MLTKPSIHTVCGIRVDTFNQLYSVGYASKRSIFRTASAITLMRMQCLQSVVPRRRHASPFAFALMRATPLSPHIAARTCTAGPTIASSRRSGVAVEQGAAMHTPNNSADLVLVAAVFIDSPMPASSRPRNASCDECITNSEQCVKATTSAAAPIVLVAYVNRQPVKNTLRILAACRSD